MVAPGGAGSPGARGRTRELGGGENAFPYGAPGNVAVFAESRSRGEFDLGGGEAGTQVPRLFSCEGTTSGTPRLGWVAAPISPFGLLPFSFLFLPCLPR